MLNLSVTGSIDYRKVMATVKKAEKQVIRRAAASLRIIAANSIRNSGKPSSPGSPPHTRKGRLRKSILFALLEENGNPIAIVGPAYNLINLAGKAHEFGGKFRGDEYPERPFMQPALELTANSLPAFFADSIKS